MPGIVLHQSAMVVALRNAVDAVGTFPIAATVATVT